MKLSLSWPPVRLRRACTPYCVLVVSLLLTTLATTYTIAVTRAKDQLRFENGVQRTQDAIQNRLETYLALLRSTSGLLAANDRLSSGQFHAYIQRLDLQKHYPGVQGIGYSVRLSPAEKAALMAQMQQQGFTNFAIQPDYPRPEYHAILYLEPSNRRNQAAIGFDMFTEPIRRVAMEQARDSGTAIASGRVTLVQELDP
ncbi:MAG TPA: CHASE domain-containing protein, partial [Candidatus Obscuribacterales bacterium]